MKKACKTNGMRFVLLVMSIAIMFSLFQRSVVADEDDDGFDKRHYTPGESYQLKVDSGYSYSESDRVDQFPFKRSYAGGFYVIGNGIREKNFEGYTAYGTDGAITFGYAYDNSLKENKKGKWSIEDDDQEKVNGIKLNDEVDSGAVIVERSYDTINWKVVETRRDFFNSHPNGENSLYEPNTEDVKRGAYYRVTVAYRIEYEKGLLKQNDRAECVEVYTFYVGEYKSTLHICELYKGVELTNTESVSTSYGFSVMSDSADSKIFVKKPKSTNYELTEQYSVFTESGNYSIRFSTAFGDEYNYSVQIVHGTEAVELKPVVYKGDDSYDNLQRMESPIGDRNMTRLFVEQTKGYTIYESRLNGNSAISVNGEGVAIYLQLNYSKEIGYGLQLVNDSYGEKKGQKLYGIETGRIDSGALIVQTSSDGKDWTNQDLGTYKFKLGLFSTDFQNQFGSGRRVQIYTPNGQDVLNGLYVKVLYAYAVEYKWEEERNIVEEYIFYLSNSNTRAVTFHNLSVEGSLQEILAEEDLEIVDIYRKAETLQDNTQTFEGFSIDTSLNPTVKYEVKRNGQSLVGSTTTFTESGRYDITLTAVGETQQLTIFVDRDSAGESKKKYFGSGFISGKRVYAETGYPVYVAGQTTYTLQKVSEEMLPLAGSIRNITTGNEIIIEATREEKSGVINEPGEYEVKLYTNNTFLGENPVGDTRVFTFRFYVISENEVPGPVVNEQLLLDFAKTNISDLCPRYFGLTYLSAGRGRITLAFSSFEEAYQYAYNHEQGEVEVLSDGAFLYNGPFEFKQKKKYESTWELADAVDFFAKEAVQECYFDLSDEYTYITLPKDVTDSEENLRKLELSCSVVVFGPGQKEKMIATEGLPIISPKKVAILEPGMEGRIKREVRDIEFIQDSKQIDSQKVIVIDSTGKSMPVSHRNQTNAGVCGVGQQLQEAECASGKVHISETNIYNDQNEYDAVFIREGDNLATVTFKTYVGEVETERSIDQSSEERSFQASAFRISSIADETDQYTFLKISCNGKDEYSYGDAIGKTIYNDPGDYTIRCINRLGYAFEFTITIKDASKFTVIRCSDGNGKVEEIITLEGNQDVRLPEFMKTGYELARFIDSNGNHYPVVLPEITFTGELSLEAEWEPKDCKVIIVDQNGNRVLDVPVKFNDYVNLREKCEETGIAAVSWSISGKQIEDGYLKIDSEGDTIVVAIVETKEESKPKTMIWIFVLLGICVVGGTAVVLFVPTKEEKKHEEEEK